MEYENKFDTLVKRIKDFHKYLGDELDYRSKIDKGNFHGGNIMEAECGSTTINIITRKGKASAWAESYHNGDPYNYKEREMTDDEIMKQLENYIEKLQSLAIGKAKKDIVREAAVKKLRDLGLFI